MQIRSHVRSLFALLLPCAAAAAQCLPGTQVAAPEWGTWYLGEPVVIGGEPAPACTVFAFCTRRPAAFEEEADYLRGLQQRFGERGLVTVAVVAERPEDRAAVEATWAGCRVVVDPDGATSSAWLGRDHVPWNVVALDRRGVVTFVGSSAEGLVDAVERTVAGEPRLDAARIAFSLRGELRVAFADLDADVAARQLDQLIGLVPHDGVAHGLRYVTEVQKRLSPQGARERLLAAVAALNGEARPLAAFADLALRCDPRGDGLAQELLAPLSAAAKAVPGDVFVRLTHLRVLVLAGQGREIGRAAMRMQKLVLRSPEACLDFASILTGDKDAVVHRDLAQRVLERAEQLGAPPRLVTAARYGAVLRCQEDPEQAGRVLDAYLAATGDGNLNNDCWYLMTELPTMGRYDWFAHALAERMLQNREAMQGHEFDTAALAKFLVGEVEEAVALQEKAIAMGGASADYRQRLERYRAAAAAPPR